MSIIISSLRVRRWSSTMVALGLMLLSAACGGSATSVPIDLVPEDAEYVVTINMAAILQDEDVRELYETRAADEASLPPTMEELLQEASTETGIDLGQFAHVVLFGKTESEEEYGAFLVRGELDRDALLAAFPAADETREYRGHQVTSSDGSTNDSSMAVLDGEALVVGSPRAVEDVIDVFEGEATAVSGSLLDTFDSMGNPWIRGAALAPLSMGAGLALEEQESMEGFPSTGAIPGGLGFLTDVIVIGFALDKQGESFEGRLMLGYPDQATAAEAHEFIEAMLTLVQGMAGDSGPQRLLTQADVTVDDASVHVSVTATAEDLDGFDIPFGMSPLQ